MKSDKQKTFYRIRGRKGKYTKPLGATKNWDVAVQWVVEIAAKNKWDIIEIERCKVMKTFRVKNEKN
ncbi:hypothetical protein [Mycoplasmopsis bovigenitalium]|uniref:hypothetical protein n=1 Tax=Mycoplasmopsis bovigenitalium TaxID=2112 RepID=UPI000BBB0042|nr:hypothetical protein [Mycoplasmopsis bovigenitalium]